MAPNRKQNVYIGSQITAYARQTIHQYVQQLTSMSGFKVFQVECDSIYYSCPSNVTSPLPFSHAVGDFKLEYSNIVNFYSFGPKHYCITCIDPKGKIQTICKFSGLGLNNESNHKICNGEVFEKFL